MFDELQERMTELEICFTHQVQLLDELNAVVADCNLRIDQLRKENWQLQEVVNSLSPPLKESPDE
jgi:SlyX protein